MQRRVLLVDDDEPLATILTYALRNEGFQVDWVNDGMKALSYLGVNRPDLIVMDIMMPNLNGLETMRITRQNELMEGVAILALSAKKLTEREARELQLKEEEERVRAEQVALKGKNYKDKLEFEKKGNLLVSKTPLPAGEHYTVVIQVRATPEAKPKNFRIPLDLSVCKGCGNAEYACICNE